MQGKRSTLLLKDVCHGLEEIGFGDWVPEVKEYATTRMLPLLYSCSDQSNIFL